MSRAREWFAARRCAAAGQTQSAQDLSSEPKLSLVQNTSSAPLFRRTFPLWLGYVFVLLFTLTPIVLLGQNISLPLLDWMDGDITGKVLLGRNITSFHDYFSPQVPQMMQGAAMWSNTPSTLLYAWLAPFSAYAIECFFAVSAAYWGMALLLRRMLSLLLAGTTDKPLHRNKKSDDDNRRGWQPNSPHTPSPASTTAAVHFTNTLHTPSPQAACGTASAPFATSDTTLFTVPLTLCAAVAVLFACLPFYTVHDLTTMGIPLVLWAFLVLWQAGQSAAARRALLCPAHARTQAAQSATAQAFVSAPAAKQNPPRSARRLMTSSVCGRTDGTSFFLVVAAYGAVLLFGACSSLAFSGYFIVGFLAFFFMVQAVRRRFSGLLPLLFALVLLCALYGVANLGLVQSLFGLGTDNFVSHRTLYAPGTLAASELISEFTTMLLHGQYHAGSKHFLALTVSVAVLGVMLLFWKQLTRAQRRLWLFGAGLLGVGTIIAVFYAFCGTAFYARLTALLGAAIASFQFDRLYFLYPTLWYTLLAVALTLTLSAGSALLRTVLQWCRLGAQRGAAALAHLLPRAAAVLALISCFAFVLRGNYQTDNWRALVTGTQPNSAITWRQFFAEDVFANIHAALSAQDPALDTIAQAPVVVSLGLSPAIALYNGFSTLDGYSNNYALSYHKQFGEALHGELVKDEALASYFYDWGNRCYLFTPQLGSAFFDRYDAAATPRQPLTNLAFDWNVLRAMGGTHVLSIAPLANCAQYGLTDCGMFSGEAYALYVYAL